MSGNNELGFLEEKKRKAEQKMRFLFGAIVIATILLAAGWYFKLGPFNKPIPVPEPTKAAVVPPPPESTATPSPTATKDAKASAAKAKADKPKHTKKK